MLKEDKEFMTIFFYMGISPLCEHPLRNKSTIMLSVIECIKDC